MRSFILSEVGIAASTNAVGAWTRLMSYATSEDVETPRLQGAKAWNERRWLIACQLSPAEVEPAVAAQLARWDGDDLVLEGFDADGLKAVQAKRKGGQLGAQHGHKGGRPRTPQGLGAKTPQGLGEGGPLSSPSPSGPTNLSNAPAGAGEAEPDNRPRVCVHHLRKPNSTQTPPAGFQPNCPRCKHVVASQGKRNGEPAHPGADDFLSLVAKPPAAKPKRARKAS